MMIQRGVTCHHYNISTLIVGLKVKGHSGVTGDVLDFVCGWLAVDGYGPPVPEKPDWVGFRITALRNRS